MFITISWNRLAVHVAHIAQSRGAYRDFVGKGLGRCGHGSGDKIKKDLQRMGWMGGGLFGLD
jgi:hypothetical protein